MPSRIVTLPSSHQLAVGLAVSLMAACPMVAAELPAARWVLEGGVSEARPGTLSDVDCDTSDEANDYFLACGDSGPLASGSGSSWALGFDTRIMDTAGNGSAWWAGLRLGRSGPVILRGEAVAVDQATAGFTADFRSDYAILILRHEFSGWGPLKPHLGLGAGVARNSLRDPRRPSEEGWHHADDGDDSGYMLRASMGLNWTIGEQMVMGLEFRHDVLDGMSTGESGDYSAVRGSVDLQSAHLVISIPFGSS
ncbi:opacity protein-like surface antigen [Natronospira proteinivora]|uniref:Opacity protein-like surface antigen n=1 Tax=Natronospira proteinivora TaxID=1807133 RepID=A0ABT1GD40_9GAMM|nr:hypothetical protein [Natronospira proteinivora]MCP1728183.1 opacity protein-like surface antigen [Natronospira proteinivora]